MNHIFEHQGVLLHVEYDVPCPPETLPLFRSVRVTDSNYKPTGPELMPLLHDTLLLVGPRGPFVDAQTFLSAIAADLP